MNLKRCIVVFDVWDEDENARQIIKLYNDPVNAANYVLEYCTSIRKDRKWTRVSDEDELKKIKSNAQHVLFGWRSEENKENPDIISIYTIEPEDFDDEELIRKIIENPVPPVLSSRPFGGGVWECGLCHSAPVGIYDDDPNSFDWFCRRCGTEVDWKAVLGDEVILGKAEEDEYGQTSER